jgi:protein-tyrosine phosphatase
VEPVGELTFYTVCRAGPGRLSIMARPVADSLADGMAGLRRRGVDVLVCLLATDELEELGLAGEGDAARAAGLEFVWIPVPDFGAPDPDAIGPTVATLVTALNDGRHVVAHCRYGIGRSSLMAATLLVETGCEPDEAWDLISTARGHRVPDSPSQVDWLRRYRDAIRARP